MVRRAEGRDAECTAVVARHRTFEPFLRAASRAYQTCTPEKPPSCFAVLLGTIMGGKALVYDVEFGQNVRTTAPNAMDEFTLMVVPCFGPAYDNVHRGFWCGSVDLLRIHRKAEARGLDLIGSIHLHPDWHRIGPAEEHGLRISEAPTPMDTYMFANTGWPVNLICYLERPNREIHYTLGAWSPPRSGDVMVCAPIPMQFLIDDQTATSADDRAIGSVFAGMVASWSRSDAVEFAQAFTTDADFTSVRCDHLHGSVQIAAAHDRLFTTVYAGTRLAMALRRVSYPRTDMAITHVDISLFHSDGSPARGIGGNPGNTMHAQAILEHRRGAWKIISFMNMVPLKRLPA